MQTLLTATVLALLASGCGHSRSAAPPAGKPGAETASISAPTEPAVWSTVVTSRLFGTIKQGARRVHLANRTVTPPCAPTAATLRAGLPGIGADTIADFLTQLGRPRSIGRGSVRPIFSVVLLGPRDVAATASRGPIWRQTLDSAGLVELSRVGLSADGREALVYFHELGDPSMSWLIQLRRQHSWLEHQLMPCPAR